MWAEAYLRGKFFAGMRSTQRSESLNAYLNKYLQNKLKLFEFVRHFDRAHGRIRQKEGKAEHDSNNGSPVMMTALQDLEKHGAEIYTASSFKKFRMELKQEALYSVAHKMENASGITYRLKKYCDDASVNTVTYEKATEIIKCSCQRFESNGIPCRHMLTVMKAENVTEIPACCITRRWCKNAKSEFEVPIHQNDQQDVANTLRFGALSAKCNNLNYLASQSKNAFDLVRTEIDGLLCRITERSSSSPKGTPSQSSKRMKTIDVEDPVQVKTKGRPSGKDKKTEKATRHCRNCGCTTHDIRHCQRLGKPPKKQKPNLKRDVQQEVDLNEKEPEDQWEYSTMPSPIHNSDVVHDRSQGVGYGSSDSTDDDKESDDGEESDDGDSEYFFDEAYQ